MAFLIYYALHSSCLIFKVIAHLDKKSVSAIDTDDTKDLVNIQPIKDVLDAVYITHNKN